MPPEAPPAPPPAAPAGPPLDSTTPVDTRQARRDAFAAGTRSIGSTVVGTFCWGLITGVALVKGGLTPLQAIGMVMLVYSGTAQLAALPLMSAGAALPAIWATALLANLRFVVYSAVIATEFRGLPLWRRLALGWMTTDTALAAYFGRGGERGVTERAAGAETVALREARFLGANALVYAGWTLGTAAGVVAAAWVPDSPRIAFIAVLAIIALVGPLLSTRASLAAAAAASAVALLGRDWPWRLGMFAAIGAGVVAALVVTARGDRAPMPAGAGGR